MMGKNRTILIMLLYVLNDSETGYIQAQTGNRLLEIIEVLI